MPLFSWLQAFLSPKNEALFATNETPQAVANAKSTVRKYRDCLKLGGKMQPDVRIRIESNAKELRDAIKKCEIFRGMPEAYPSNRRAWAEQLVVKADKAAAVYQIGLLYRMLEDFEHAKQSFESSISEFDFIQEEIDRADQEAFSGVTIEEAATSGIISATNVVLQEEQIRTFREALFPHIGQSLFFYGELHMVLGNGAEAFALFTRSEQAFMSGHVAPDPATIEQLKRFKEAVKVRQLRS